MEKKDAVLPGNRSIFLWLADLFSHRKVAPILIGGYALVVNKVDRTTFDIDFMMTGEYWLAIQEDVLTAGYTYLNKTEHFIQLKSPNPTLRDLDFVLCDNLTLEKLRLDSQTTTIAGAPFQVASPVHLIAMKLHAMQQNPNRELKDFPDIVQLIRANGINPKTEPIRNLFEKYGFSHLLQRVENLLEGYHG